MSEEQTGEDESIPLPPGVRPKHGSWHYVEKHKWTKLCRISEGRARLYERVAEVVGACEDAVWYGIIMYIKHGMTKLAESTQRHYRADGLRMLHHFGHYRWHEVLPTHCKQFLVWSEEQNRGTTGNREASMMSSVWEYAMGKGWALVNPWRGVRRNTETPSRVYVEHQSLVSQLDRAPPELYALMGTAYLTTIRQTDLRLVKKAQRVLAVVTIEENGRERQVEREVLRLTESKTGKHNDHEITTTVAVMLRKAAEHQEAVAKRYEAAAERLVELSQRKRAAKSLARAAQVRAQPYIFLSNRGWPWTESGLASALQRFAAPFQFRQLRPKGQTDAQTKSTTGHKGQMLGVYIRRRQLRAVK